MTLPQKTATIFGGTGFIGRYIVRDLARAGYRVKVATRIPEKAYFLKPYGTVGQVVPFVCNLKDQASLEAAIAGSEVVVNCIGILYQRRRGEFQRLQADLPGRIAEASARLGVQRLVHLSALGVDKAASLYARTKLEGEKKIMAAFPAATILRPSVVFGEEDRFFNLFASLMRVFPIVPVIGAGTKLQPVYVGDVADAVMAAVTRPDCLGGVYELGGPEVVTLREIHQRLMAWTGMRRGLMAVPFGMAKVQASVLQCLPPKPLLTTDQVITLKTDSIVGTHALGFGDLGLRPAAMELIVPGYLERFRAGGRFADKKVA